MIKPTSAMIVLYFAIQIPQSQEIIAAFKQKYWSPPGCIACFKSADKRFFKNIITLQPKCAQQELAEFRTFNTMSYLQHICKEGNENEFNNQLKNLAASGKKVLKQLAKCIEKDSAFEFPQKFEIKEFIEKFRERREECGGTDHLDKEIKTFWESLPNVGALESLLLTPSSE